ncbi:MAG: bifunctional nuclease domain-containing protein, partial [Planctomycetota bacterium]|nr:bifunctional nuclease domain-containing protein [Planctomycetota bacterium]
MLVPVSISRLLIREMADSQFVTLQELEGGRSFPIAIGLTEAFAIERRMSGATPPRPQTHDLLDSAIASLGGRLVRVEIHTLDGGTFHA